MDFAEAMRCQLSAAKLNLVVIEPIRTNPRQRSWLYQMAVLVSRDFKWTTETQRHGERHKLLLLSLSWRRSCEWNHLCCLRRG